MVAGSGGGLFCIVGGYDCPTLLLNAFAALLKINISINTGGILDSIAAGRFVFGSIKSLTASPDRLRYVRHGQG